MWWWGLFWAQSACISPWWTAAGRGLVPLTGFGYNLAVGVAKAVETEGAPGDLYRRRRRRCRGIAAAVFFGNLVALFFRSKPKT